VPARCPHPWRALLLVVLLATLSLAACSGPDNGDASPTATVALPSVTPTGDVGVVPTATAPEATSTSTPEATATTVVEPTPTPTQEAPPTATATLPPPTAIATATSAPQPTSTPVASDAFITIQTADTDQRIVALTFDAGSDRGFAGDILDTLAEEGVVATFGMTGNWAEANPALIQRMVDEGHMLINHTVDHRSFTGFSTQSAPLTSPERAAELAGVEDIVRNLTGYELAPYFRPPYGDYDDSVIADLQANGYTVNVMWTVDSLGWAGRSVDEITQRVINGTVPGAIHLFHVGAASQDAAALPGIIHQLRDMGYEFVTVADMVGR
jgi:peptidoglycan-N-acetylglucosamine deacetylase